MQATSQKPLYSFHSQNRYTAGVTEQTCERTSAAIDNDLLDPYERLVTIEVLGKKLEVPEKNRLLRCFQYLSLNSISYGDFCWNGECTNCQVWYRTPEDLDQPPKTALACRVEVVEGMIITSMSQFIKIEGVNK